MQDLQQLQPQSVFHWFQEISKIPRGSGNEQEISDFLKKFAEDRGLSVKQDEALNIIIHKPGTKGFENSPWVSLQGHMDIVCEKAPGSDHDFEKDPIELILDGDILHANNTTMGGDDGIAIAYALALLDADDIPHPNLEVIITTNEETGMDGAAALKAEDLKGDYLLNIDSEEEGIFILGCAGGADFQVTFPAKPAAAPAGLKGYQLELSHFHGGHSGQEIHAGYANAIKVLGRLLYEVQKTTPVRIAQIDGGTKHNAIPAQATCSFACPADATGMLKEIWTVVQNEFGPLEPDMTMTVKETAVSEVLSAEDSRRLVDYLLVVPHGPRSMSPKMQGLVQTSLNCAILRQEGDQIRLQLNLRSGVDSLCVELLDQLSVLTEAFGLDYERSAVHSAWEFNPESALKDRAIQVYRDMYGKEPEVTAIHAGVECGLLKSVMPNTDMLSLGPDILEVHTPRERLSVSSVKRTWEFILKLLASFQ